MSDAKRPSGLPAVTPLRRLEISEGPAPNTTPETAHEEPEPAPVSSAPPRRMQDVPTQILPPPIPSAASASSSAASPSENRPAWARAVGPAIPLHLHADLAPQSPNTIPESGPRSRHPATVPDPAPSVAASAPSAPAVPGGWALGTPARVAERWSGELDLRGSDNIAGPSGPSAAPSSWPAPSKEQLLAPSPLSVAMLGPPGVGKTYYCKGLVQLFLRPDRLGLHVENLTAVIRRGERTLPLEGYLERFKAGSRESPTAPAHGLNLHELVIDWGKRDHRNRQAGAGRASILLNDTAGEILRNLNENQDLQRYVCQAETLWMLLPAWVLTQSEGEVRGQPRSFRRAVRDFTDEVDWMYDHASQLQGKRRFVMVWTMGNDPAVRSWAREVGLYDEWLRAGEAMRSQQLFAMARFVSFQRRLNEFLDSYLRAVPGLDLLQNGLARLRKLGQLRHSLINVIDDLELEGSTGGEEVRENLLHVEAPVLSLLSKKLAFGV